MGNMVGPTKSVLLGIDGTPPKSPSISPLEADNPSGYVPNAGTPTAKLQKSVRDLEDIRRVRCLLLTE